MMLACSGRGRSGYRPTLLGGQHLEGVTLLRPIGRVCGMSRLESPWRKPHQDRSVLVGSNLLRPTATPLAKKACEVAANPLFPSKGLGVAAK